MQSFNRRFWYAERRLPLRRGRRRSAATIRPAGPTSFSPSRCDIRSSTRQRWRAGDRSGARTAADAGGPALAGAGQPDYKPHYYGDLRARDAAYHQGTVWAWLIGPFIDAWLKVHPDDRAGARQFLAGLRRHLGEACVGSISEIFDAEAPYTPRGCIAQAWSVAEVLRCWVKTTT